MCLSSIEYSGPVTVSCSRAIASAVQGTLGSPIPVVILQTIHRPSASQTNHTYCLNRTLHFTPNSRRRLRHAGDVCATQVHPVVRPDVPVRVDRIQRRRQGEPSAPLKCHNRFLHVHRVQPVLIPIVR
ncbi:hypothetical protein, variant [Aphanomyces invadans]|uniref:Uncharacterized protein n=1 Tax=Aphanomyces invadans TaxID=157072 RepID=A0A024UDW1_9STRA|nr:hypothetical protein H310_05183 [Aphanomyces invadans]XP_008868048.1 hypothetical protein, variant [Aphanomyces invadans]ETW03818.1 hypothetical protein H310_05183 [Aphanomyces invadans]ETW03819.1 hypothetical protein, variant [Aphanomyces invadans]|eukprot:XP_008868047.1 hypothetical protein H310_05183 [Aphanomyces invadans]